MNLYHPLLSALEGTLPNGCGWKWSSSEVLTYYHGKKNPSVVTDCGYCVPFSPVTGKTGKSQI